MIKSFKCRKTEALYAGESPRKFRAFADVTVRKLQMLKQATALEDLFNPPGNRLEKLVGDRAGQWSIRINKQYRLCFTFHNGDAYDVEIADYH